jgi:hypothetical protein
MTQWEYRLEVNLGRPYPKFGWFTRLLSWLADSLSETKPTDPHPVEAKTLTESLDQLGQDGWELISVVPMATIFGTENILYYFKRDRNEDRPLFTGEVI